MRKGLLPLIVLVGITACNLKKNQAPVVATRAPEAYSYTIGRPDNWEINTNPKNTAVSLRSVKAFELGAAACSALK